MDDPARGGGVLKARDPAAAHPPARREIGALLMIVIFAAILRFGWSGVSSFAWDEANLSLDALRTARGGQIALAGQPSSVAIPFFPASVYAFAIPYALSPDPLIAAGWVSALSTLTVIGVWALGRQMFGGAAGIAAALFLAANPYAVLYGRSIWQPNLLAPLGLAWLAAGYLAFVWRDTARFKRRRTLAIAVCVFLGGATVQIHFAGLALVVGTGMAFVWGRWWRDLRPVIVGGAAAVALAIPYGVFLAENPAILERYGAVVGGETRYDLTGLGNLLQLGVGIDWAYLGLGERDLFARDPAAAALAAAWIGLGSIVVISAWRRKADRIAAGWLLLAVCISPLVFIRHTTPVLPHYQLVALPALAITVGAAMALSKHRIARVGIAALAFTLTVLWGVRVATTLQIASVQPTPNSALASTLRESRDAAGGALAMRQHDDAPILMFTHGDDPEIDGEVAVFQTLLWGRPHRTINGDVLLILPPQPAVLMATLAPFQAWEELQAAGLADDFYTFPRREGLEPFIAARYDGVTLPAGFTASDPVTFADGTTFTGWRARRVGDRFRISTRWIAGDALQTGTIQQFHHLRRAETPADAPPDWGSDVPLSLHTWRVGDTVIVMADFFDIPAGTYRLTFGHYTLPAVTRIARADGGDSLQIDGVIAS